MKIYIGPYINWIGPYQLADLLKYVGVSEEKRYKLGKWLAGDPEPDGEELFSKKKDGDNLLVRFCVWVHRKRHRKVKIKLHKYDTWNMNDTLALIILPMLKQLKETKHGSPMVDDDDVPEHLRSTASPTKENAWDIDDLFHERWDWVMNEMIWAFEQMQPDCDWEEQYHSGEIDMRFKKSGNNYEIVDGPNNTHKFDKEGHKRHSDRIDRGVMLFGKYYRGLWD